MKYNDSINELFIRFPMLKSVYESEGGYIKDLPHLCYEIVFVPFIRQTYLINDEYRIRLICNFMEYMASSNDEMVSELLVVSVLESILSERELIGSLRQYFGTQTSAFLSVMEKETGWS